MLSAPLLPSLPDSLWLGVIALDSVLSMGQIELNRTNLDCLKENCILTLKLLICIKMDLALIYQTNSHSPDLWNQSLIFRYSLISYSGHSFLDDSYSSAKDSVRLF